MSINDLVVPGAHQLPQQPKDPRACESLRPPFQHGAGPKDDQNDRLADPVGAVGFRGNCSVYVYILCV